MIKQLPFPNKKYQIIYADPPWSYKNKKVFGKFKNKNGYIDGGCLSKYSTMDLIDICNLPIRDISDKNAILFLWTTTPFLEDCFKVVSAWGFKFKTALYWRKIMSLGMGFWFRGQVEILIVAIKGKVKAFHSQKPNFIQTRALRHSEKPDEFRKLIEEVTNEYPDKIELFARQQADGWDVWGNEELKELYRQLELIK